MSETILQAQNTSGLPQALLLDGGGNLKTANTGGSIPYHNLTAASTNFTNVKNTAALMYSCRISNTSNATIYVKFYNKATTPSTTDVPKDTLMVNATTLVALAFPEGMKFTTGFGWAATGAVDNNDNTSIAANCIVDFSLDS